jgi:chromosome segregation ATPase
MDGSISIELAAGIFSGMAGLIGTLIWMLHSRAMQRIEALEVLAKAWGEHVGESNGVRAKVERLEERIDELADEVKSERVGLARQLGEVGATMKAILDSVHEVQQQIGDVAKSTHGRIDEITKRCAGCVGRTGS